MDCFLHGDSVEDEGHNNVSNLLDMSAWRLVFLNDGICSLVL